MAGPISAMLAFLITRLPTEGVRGGSSVTEVRSWGVTVIKGYHWDAIDGMNPVSRTYGESY